MSDSSDWSALMNLLGMAMDPNATEKSLDNMLDKMDAQELEENLPPMNERAQSLEEALAWFADMNRSFTSKEIEYYMKQYFRSVELAKLVARHPSCPARLLQSMLYFLPQDAASNPSLGKYQKEIQNWDHNLKSSKPRQAAANWWRDGTLYSSYVNPRMPYRYKVDYWMAHGSNADKRFIVSCEYIDDDILDNYVSDKSSTIRKAIAQRSRLPEHIITTLAADRAKTVREALAENSVTPAMILSGLAQDQEEAVRSAALANDNCPQEAIHVARLEEAARPGLEEKPVDKLTFDEFISLLGDENTPADILAQLARHNDAWIRAGAALHRNTTADVLCSLTSDTALVVKQSLAFNRNTPSEILVRLLEAGDKSLWRALANNPALPQQQQLFLVKHADEPLLQELADTTDFEEVWRALSKTKARASSKKKSWRDALKMALEPGGKGLYQLQRGINTRQLFVAKMIARHPKCPESLKGYYAYYLFDSLAQNPAIALSLLENPQAIKGVPYADWKIEQWLSDGNAPGHVANYYLHSDDIKRRRKAVTNHTACIDRLQPQVYVDDIHMKKRLAVRKGNTAFMFEVLARDNKASVRELVAKNIECPGEVLVLLASDKNNTVKVAATQNRSYAGNRSESKRKANGSESELRNKGQKRDRIKMAREAKKVRILKDLAQDRGYEVRAEVANNGITPAAVLMQLARDESEVVRASVARHPNVPDDMLCALCKDRHKEVRYAAMQNLSFSRCTNVHGSDIPLYDETLFEEMWDDSHLAIRKFIARRTASGDIQAKLLAAGVEDINLQLAANKRLDSELANKLKCDQSRAVRRELLGSTISEDIYLELLSTHEDIVDNADRNYTLITCPEVQKKLSVHPDPRLRQKLVWYVTEKDLLLKLANDEAIEVRSVVSRSDEIGSKHVAALMAQEINSEILSQLYNRHRTALKPYMPDLLQHRSERIRAFLAGNLELNKVLENTYIDDESPLVRGALIQNGTAKLSKEARDKLRNDSNDRVRFLLKSYYRH